MSIINNLRLLMIIKQPSPLQIDRAAFSANIILLIGYAFAAWFQTYEFIDRARETIAISVYFLGFALIVISGIIELSVDICSVRTVGHGRYHSNSPMLNRIISILFIATGILDIVGFCYLMLREFDIENKVLLCSAYIIFIMAALCLFFQMKEGVDDTSDMIDAISNSLVLIGAGLFIVLLHLDVSAKKDYGDVPDKMELAMVIIFLVSAVLYVIADSLRFTFSVGTAAGQSQSTPLPTHAAASMANNQTVQRQP